MAAEPSPGRLHVGTGQHHDEQVVDQRLRLRQAGIRRQVPDLGQIDDLLVRAFDLHRENGVEALDRFRRPDDLERRFQHPFVDLEDVLIADFDGRPAVAPERLIARRVIALDEAKVDLRSGLGLYDAIGPAR